MRVHVARSRHAGDGHVYILESYRDAAGKATNRIVEKLGLVSALAAADPGWRAKADARARELTAAKESTRGLIAYDTAEPADPEGALNIGWWLVEAAWKRLGLDSWLRRQRREKGWDTDVEAIARVLVASRVLWPGSKRAAVAKAPKLAFAPGIELGETYRALDHIADVALRLQTRARRSLAGPGEELGVVFYDVTNYFFHIDHPDPDPTGKHAARGDASRQRGAGKEHRPLPIIQMGLFTDPAGIPVAYRLFDGNVPDSVTLGSALAEFKTGFGAPRVTVVADTAMNNSHNIADLHRAGDGWVLANSIRLVAKDLRAWALEDDGWTASLDDHGRVATKSKSKTTTRKVPWTTPEGLAVTKLVEEKVIAHWSRQHAERDAHTRAEMLAKAQRLVENPSAFKASNRRGVKKYVHANQTDPATGEIEPSTQVLSLDTALAEADAALDGYHLIHTSQIDVPDAEVLAAYHELWRIEDAFKVSKTELQARPVFVWTRPHIEAHFTICFLALLITRLLQHWTGNLSAHQLRDALRDLTAQHTTNGIHLISRPALWDIIDQATGTNTNHKWATITDLRAWRHDLTTTITTKRPPTQPDGS
jgi:hypothetical protein